MRLSFVEMCGFRGFRKPVRIVFAESFTIIDGRNGVGKSTIFDAIEFALTGTLSKYGDAKALRESVENYIWWLGAGAPPEDRYVEVGFTDADGEISVRRTPLGLANERMVPELSARLCNLTVAPKASLAQLCVTSMIRDEQITNLSLDMGETDRYSLLRDALGASDAEWWITRAASLQSAAKRRLATAEKEVTAANTDLTNASRRLDAVRASLASDDAVVKAKHRLRAFTGTDTTADQLVGPTRERIARARSDIASIVSLLEEWSNTDEERGRRAGLLVAVRAAELRTLEASESLAGLPPDENMAETLSEAAVVSRELVTLANLGRHLGLNEGRCPLCAQAQSAEEYLNGLAVAEQRARRLDENMQRIVIQREARSRAEADLAKAHEELEQARRVLAASNKLINSFEERRNALGVSPALTSRQLSSRVVTERAAVEAAEIDLRIIETLRLNRELESAKQAELTTRTRLKHAQERYGRARKAETSAGALHDASRRAAAETLDRRLERVLPLMAELYGRLRPHPIWSNIEYSIRGDVRRFLKLQVGDGLNPQFIFSSGQRRATGLAFLLSVNLSLAWSRWKSILLDDPVQHIDDFRSVHLAEVLSHLVGEERQIVCAVEDPALADLLSRRLPLQNAAGGKRITLAGDETGALAIREERALQPLVPSVLVTRRQLAVG